MNKFTRGTIFIISLFLSTTSQAQVSRLEKYWTLGVQVNAANYFGDLNKLESYTATRIDYTRPSFGIQATKKLSTRWQLRGSLSYIRLRGDSYTNKTPNSINELARYGKNLHFRNSLYELGLTAMYEFKQSKGRFYRRQYFTPYVFGGIALFYHNPRAKTPLDYNGPGAGAGEWVALRPLSTEGQGLPGYGKKYGLFQPAIPIGAGVKFRINDRLDLGFEVGMRILFTDYIDDVGGEYPNMFDLRDNLGENAELAIRMSDRSLEERAAVSENQRDIDKVIAAIGGSRTNTGHGSLNDENNYQTLIVNGKVINRLNEYGIRGQVRGDGNGKASNGFSNNDIYVVTGFHLNYILTTKRIPRYRTR